MRQTRVGVALSHFSLTPHSNSMAQLLLLAHVLSPCHSRENWYPVGSTGIGQRHSHQKCSGCARNPCSLTPKFFSQHYLAPDGTKLGADIRSACLVTLIQGLLFLTCHGSHRTQDSPWFSQPPNPQQLVTLVSTSTGDFSSPVREVPLW